MDNPIFWIVIVVALLGLIWLWRRRSAAGARGDSYDAGPSVQLATYKPAAAAPIEPPVRAAPPGSASAEETVKVEARLARAGAESARPAPVREAPVPASPTATPPPAPAPPAQKAPTSPAPGAAPAAAAKPAEADDLTAIEGIGPKISRVLRGAGVRTYAQLAALKPAAIKQILTDGGVRVGDPGTWPRQAKLAADGKWEKLKTLQDNLKGGRRV